AQGSAVSTQRLPSSFLAKFARYHTLGTVVARRIQSVTPLPVGRRAVSKSADPWGIAPGYVSALGDWRKTSAETRRALLEAMGADASESGPPTAPVRVLRAGSRARLGLEGELQLEDGGVKPVRGTVPAGVPPGYHTLRTRTGEARVFDRQASGTMRTVHTWCRAALRI